MHFPARELGAADVRMPRHQRHWHLHHQPPPLHSGLPAAPLTLHYGPHCHPGEEVYFRLQVSQTLSTLSFRSIQEGEEDRGHVNWLGNVGLCTWEHQWEEALWRSILVIIAKTLWHSKTKILSFTIITVRQRTWWKWSHCSCWHWWWALPMWSSSFRILAQIPIWFASCRHARWWNLRLPLHPPPPPLHPQPHQEGMRHSSTFHMWCSCTTVLPPITFLPPPWRSCR